MTQLHAEATQPPPPDDELLEELEPEHAPPVQVWSDEQALHASPPEPHAAGSVPGWHVFVMSQHPLGQDTLEHPPPSSLPPELPPGASSSIVTPLLLLLLLE